MSLLPSELMEVLIDDAGGVENVAGAFVALQAKTNEDGIRMIYFAAIGDTTILPSAQAAVYTLCEREVARAQHVHPAPKGKQ